MDRLPSQKQNKTAIEQKIQHKDKHTVELTTKQGSERKSTSFLLFYCWLETCNTFMEGNNEIAPPAFLFPSISDGVFGRPKQATFLSFLQFNERPELKRFCSLNWCVWRAPPRASEPPESYHPHFPRHEIRAPSQIMYRHLSLLTLNKRRMKNLPQAVRGVFTVWWVEYSPRRVGYDQDLSFGDLTF